MSRESGRISRIWAFSKGTDAGVRPISSQGNSRPNCRPACQKGPILNLRPEHPTSLKTMKYRPFLDFSVLENDFRTLARPGSEMGQKCLPVWHSGSLRSAALQDGQVVFTPFRVKAANSQEKQQSNASRGTPGPPGPRLLAGENILLPEKL